MASDDDRKKAGAAKRRKRLAVIGVVTLAYLVFYVSSYLMVRPKAWVQPHPLVYQTDDLDFTSGPGAFYPENTISPAKPYDRRMGVAADVFFMPLIWAEWICWEREVYFEQWSVDHGVSPSF